jgi:hypothetical protein
MRRLILSVVLLLAALVATASPAGAIVGGAVDGSRHPAVGGLVSPRSTPTAPGSTARHAHLADGVPHAAHCAEDGERVGVTFDADYKAGDKVYYGTFHADPRTRARRATPTTSRSSCFDKAIKGITPALLPEAGSLSNLRRRSASRRWATAPTR